MGRPASTYRYRGFFVTDATDLQHFRLCRIEEGVAKAQALLNWLLAERMFPDDVENLRAALNGETVKSPPLTTKQVIARLSKLEEKVAKLTLRLNDDANTLSCSNSPASTR